MTFRTLLFVLLAAVTVLRWLFNAPQELTGQDAYLVLCGLNPSIAYLEGPGGTAVCAALGSRLAGAGPLGVGFLWPVFALLATLALYQLVTPLAGPRAGLASAVLLNLLPAFNVASLQPGCALPVALGALAFLAAAWRAIETSSLRWWTAAGLCAAAALLFNYTALFLWPALALVLTTSRRWRPLWREPGPWLALAPVLVVLGLLLRWNAAHGWVHFITGTWQTATTLQFKLLPAGLAAAAQSASPLVLLALAAAWSFALWQLTFSRRAKFLFVPATFALGLVVYDTLREASALTSGLTALALTLPLLAWLPPLRSDTFMRAALSLVFLSAAGWTALQLYRTPARPPLVNAAVVAAIEEQRRQSGTDPDRPVFLIAEDAALASAVAIHLRDTGFVVPGHPPVYVVESPYAASQYALWPRYDQFIEAPALDPAAAPDPFTEQDGANLFLWRSALYITTQSAAQLPQAITAAFAAHRLVAEINTPAGRILRIYLCEEYETLPL